MSKKRWFVVPAAVILAAGPLFGATGAQASPSVVHPNQESTVCHYDKHEYELSYGDTGSDVKQAQCELNNTFAYGSDTDYGKGPYGGIEVDGQFGARTRQVTRDLQASCGLHVDGIIGPKTWAKLDHPCF